METVFVAYSSNFFLNADTHTLTRSSITVFAVSNGEHLIHLSNKLLAYVGAQACRSHTRPLVPDLLSPPPLHLAPPPSSPVSPRPACPFLLSSSPSVLLCHHWLAPVYSSPAPLLWQRWRDGGIDPRVEVRVHLVPPRLTHALTGSRFNRAELWT